MMIGRIVELNRQLGGGVITLPDRAGNRVRFCLEPEMELTEGDTVSFDLAQDAVGRTIGINVVRQERNTSKFNTEDKGSWVVEGASLEVDFVERVVPFLKRDIRIHPDKKTNPYSIDLYDYDKDRPADLKTQETPFFLVAKKYPGFGYAPRHAVTFNRKDYERYKKYYPDCDIYYYVDWKQTEFRDVRIEPLTGVWVAAFRDMRALIEQKKVALHPYRFRQGDQINARDSYIFDLRNPIFTQLL